MNKSKIKEIIKISLLLLLGGIVILQIIIPLIEDAKVFNSTPDYPVRNFRNQCMQDNNIICSSHIMNSFGEDGTLKDIWSNLTIDERRNIGISLFNYLNSDVFHTSTINTICGDANCSAPMALPNGMCGPNAIIRVLRLGTSDKMMDWCHYINGTGNIVSYYYPNSYGLPVYAARVEGTNSAHSIVALQIGDDFSDFNSWLFSQYSNPNIIPGDSQMPITTNVMLVNLFSGDLTFACNTPNDGNPIIVWDIDNLPTPVPTPTPTAMPEIKSIIIYIFENIIKFIFSIFSLGVKQ